MKNLVGRLHDIASGKAGLDRDTVLAYRARWEREGYELPILDESLIPKAVPQIRSPRVTASGGCCSGKRSAVRRFETFSQAVSRFIGDGGKFASSGERKRRSQACQSCPLRDGFMCGECGCFLPAKRSMRLEQCPVHLWLPDVRPRRQIVHPIRNLMMHIMPIAGNNLWRWNVEQIAKRQDLFNGKRIVSIAVMSQGKRIHERPKRHLSTENAQAVVEEFAKHGMRIDEFIVIENNSKLREVATFVPMLQRLQSQNSNEVTFSCHAKAVTHTVGSTPHRWAEAMYVTCLDHWPTIHNALEQYSMAGGIRRFGQFSTPGNNRWHYSGTFYWFRHDDVFSRRWQLLDQKFFGTESWPGRMFESGECACIYADEAPDPYSEGSWQQVLGPALESWKKARGLE